MSSPIEQVREVNRSEITVFRRGGRAVEDVKAKMLQGIMQSTKKVKAMTTTKSDEDEAKKPATRDKPKKSLRDKERRKDRRKVESKLKDEFSIVSTATGVQGQEMMIMKHVNLTVQGDRAVPPGQSEQGEDREPAASQSRSIQEPMQMPSRGKQMVWP